MKLIYLFLLIFIFKKLICCDSSLFSKQINCVADYLLIGKNLQTEIFAEKINGEWKIQRGISENISKEIKINRKEMGKIMGAKYTKNCFRKNKKLVDQRENVLEVKNIFDKIKNKYLILSENYQKKLEEQSFCLANFLFKHFGPAYMGGKPVDDLIEDDFEAIRNNYKICFGEESLVMFSRWKRGMLKENQINEEFIEDLEKCNKILKTKKRQGRKDIVYIFTLILLQLNCSFMT
ncbi:unnamed protein product [Meloidogyne enterolobii]|uniref:Uncharacterized protein n=1 Tax=Meloidogyne enterolobii TaxID=390850 RepID=A0ACB1AI83_MELEN